MKRKKRVPTPISSSDKARLDLLTNLAALHYETTSQYIKSARQYGKYPEARFVIMYLSHKHKVASSIQTGIYFGREGQYVNVAVKKINGLLSVNDAEILAAIEFIEQSFLIINDKLNKTTMEVLSIANGIVQVVLVPQNAHESATLQRLLSEGPLEVLSVLENLTVLGVPLRDGIIIRQKSKEVENASN